MLRRLRVFVPSPFATLSVTRTTGSRYLSASRVSRESMQCPPWREWRLDPPAAIPSGGRTLAAQASLPPLPLPPLDKTINKLLASCKPFASPAQFSALESKLASFKQGLGPELQKRLEKHASARSKAEGNWIAEWWDTLAYMSYRDPVVINVSYYYAWPRLPQSPAPSATGKADPSFVSASLTASALDFRQMLIDGTLEADAIGGRPICMESYKWTFNACRIPSLPNDHAVKIPEDSPEAQFVTAIRRNRFYSIPLPSSSIPYNARVSALREAFEAVRQDADSKDASEPLGVLTASDRDPWARARQSLIKVDPRNVESLASIEKSAFVVALDDTQPIRGTETADARFYESLWFGGRGENDRGGNRWWDKPMQYVVYDNGESGVVGEHSCMDGTPTTRLNDWITHRLLKTGKVPAPPADVLSPPPPTLIPKPLPFTLSPTIKAAVANAAQDHQTFCSQNTLAYAVYKGYGKETIKKYKTSPDGWAQMCIQLAWALTMGLEKSPCGTYESAQVRRFKLGRTEVVRTVSDDSAAWVEAMLSPASAATTAERKRLFQAAVAAHGAYMKEASAGMGVDRHWLGLKMCPKPGEPAPEVFDDPVVRRAGTWNLSTSQIYSENFPGYGWGAVVPDGFGIPYMIHPHALQWTVTGKTAMPVDAMRDNLCKACEMVLALHEEAEGAEAPQAKL